MEDFQAFIGGMENSRQQISMQQHLAMRASSRSELDNVVSAMSRQVRAQLDLIEGISDTMQRRTFLRSVGVLGLPALMPASAVRDALTKPLPDTPPVSLSAIRAAVEDLWRARQDSQYEQLALMLPRVLAALQHHDHAHDLLSMTYQCVAASMAKIGTKDLGWVAAERGIVSAKASGNATVLASAERRYAHALLAMDRNDEALQVALAAAGALEVQGVRALSVYGALVLTAAVAASRVDDALTADRLLVEAQSTAIEVGEGRNDYFTLFSSTNVALHRVSVALELREPAEAIEYAQAINADALPAERRSHFHIDLALAHYELEHSDDCIDELLTAEAVAPEEVRYQATARTLIASMQRDQPNEKLDALAVRIGIDA